jgi:alpha-L-glutamate ligase-like protein
MTMQLANPFKLRQQGMLGMNERNVSFIGRYNPRQLYPRVDNKLQTKLLAQQSGLAVPKLLGVVQYQHDVRDLPNLLEGYDSFVIKPAKGSGGKGIKVVQSRQGHLFVKASGELVNHTDVKRHVSNLLSGLYSLGGQPDVAMIESLVRLDPALAPYSFEGIPDIRIIIFKGYPIMAMLRLSTHESDGKANLHQGAVGVGIDLATGRAIGAVQHDRPISRHPDTQQDFANLQVPDWQRVLLLASSTYEMAGLGYLGADIVLDKEHGPLMLELNARPGLAIQIANDRGLLPRLKNIESLKQRHKRTEERVAYSIKHFGHPKQLSFSGQQSIQFQ